MFTKFGKMRTDPSRKYGCSIVVSRDKAQDKDQLRRQIYLRPPPNKDDPGFRRGIGSFGKSKAWHKVAESRIKTNVKNLKPESRIIKHNLEKSKQLISEETDQEDKPLDFHSETEICQVDGIPVQFGSQDSPSPLEEASQMQEERKENGLPSPEFVGQDIVYHVFYQDNPLDIIESLLVAKSSDDPLQKEDGKSRSDETQEFQQADSSGTEESVFSQKNVNRDSVEGTNRLLEKICEDIQVNLGAEDSSKFHVEETPRRNHFRASWNTLPAVLRKQENRIRSLAFARVGTKSSDRTGSEQVISGTEDLEAESNQALRISDTRETTISWNISSPEAENMEQSLLQLLNARLQLLSSQKLRYLLGVMDKLEKEEVALLTTATTTTTQTPSLLQQQVLDVEEISGFKGTTITLRILSTWGDKTSVGLVESRGGADETFSEVAFLVGIVNAGMLFVMIGLFDIEGKKINVLPTDIRSNREDLDISTLSRIFNGAVDKTMDDSSVWETSLPSPGSPPLEIHICVPCDDTTVGHLEIWNHDQNISKGIRDLQMLVNGELLWDGTVSKSSGNPVFDSCTRILLLEEPPGSTSAVTPSSPKSAVDDNEEDLFQAARQAVEDSGLTSQTEDTKDALEEKIENDSLWSMAATYLHHDGKEEELKDNDYNLETKTEKLDKMELEEIERFINSDDSTLFNDETNHRNHSGSLEAGASYEMFDMLNETADENAFFEALNYAEQEAGAAESPEPEADDHRLSDNLPSSDFCISLLPRGSKLTINIHSTWGDPHYVGLSGIEIFDDSGKLLHINGRKQIQVNFTSAALPSGLYCSPCPVERLVDNVNVTCDDSHMWLAPFCAGHPCSITISLERVTTVGMVRFWNYNKSNMHSYRGARLINMFLDSILIFSGELRRATGMLDTVHHAEPILFTEDEAAISCIEHHDRDSGIPDEFDSDPAVEGYNSEPSLQSSMFKLPVPSSQSRWADQAILEHSMDKAPFGRVLRLNLLRSWGDCYYFGLTGIQVLDENGNVHNVQSELITAKPRDLNDIPGHNGDYRTLDKLVDGCNVTTDDRHMWLVPYDGPEAEHYLEIAFKSPITMAALRIWNYNKSLDDTFRGIKWIQVFVDDTEVSPSGGCLIRKAPGTDKLDFGQVLPLSKRPKRNSQQLEMHTVRERAKLRRLHTEMLHQEYLTPLLPSGHIVKFALLSTWGDHQYLGLNGIELYDEMGQIIPVLKHKVHVVPDMSTHFSNPDKLFNGVNNTWDTQNMWLSMRDYSDGNHIYMYFNEPVMISYIKLWNYSRNPTFGVRDIEIFVDDMLIYKGYVRKAISANSRHLSDTQNFPQSILFTNDEETVIANEENVFYCGGIPNTDIILINDNYVVSDGQLTT